MSYKLGVFRMKEYFEDINYFTVITSGVWLFLTASALRRSARGI